MEVYSPFSLRSGKLILLKIALTFFFVLLPVVVFTACDQEDVEISEFLFEGRWTISEINSNSATPAPTTLINTEVTFADGGVDMSGPCNQMGGFYEVDEAGKVTRSEVHMTLKDCGPMDEQEVVLLRYFQDSNQLSFNGEQLIMQSLQGEVYFTKNSE